MMAEFIAKYHLFECLVGLCLLFPCVVQFLILRDRMSR